MNSFERTCFNLLGHRMKSKRADYVKLRNDLMQARITTPFEAYLATAYVTSVAVGLIFAVIIGFLTYFLRLPEMIVYRGALPAVFVALSDYRLLIGTIVITIFSLAIFGGITYMIFMVYPGISAGDRRR
ncbi:MAG: secretion system protein, partial [Methanomicrobiaceae archaeon]|nr:secretion system protein [Methanomicrobiaceae archaeon]